MKRTRVIQLQSNFSSTHYTDVVKCDRALWLRCNPQKLRQPLNEIHLFESEKDKLLIAEARKIYEGSRDLSQGGIITGNDLVKATEAALQTTERSFFNAAFQSPEGNFFVADIFVRYGEECTIFMVKRADKIKSWHVDELGWCWQILMDKGFDRRKVLFKIILPNTEYVMSGVTLNRDELFVMEHTTWPARRNKPMVWRNMPTLKRLPYSRTTPGKKLGDHCILPHKCPFYNHCWGPSPERMLAEPKPDENSESQPQESKTDYYDEEKLTARQHVEIAARKSGMVQTDIDRIRKFTNKIGNDGIVHYFNLEAIEPAVPFYHGTSCLQKIPVQFSLTTRNGTNNKLIQYDYTPDLQCDPRLGFIEKFLKTTEDNGIIVVYEKKSVVECLQELEGLFQAKYAIAIRERISRMIDLNQPIRSRYYYHPDMRGDESLERLAACLMPDYPKELARLSLKSREAVTHSLEMMRHKSFQERQEAIQAICEYGSFKTSTMIRIVNQLSALSRKKGRKSKAD